LPGRRVLRSGEFSAVLNRAVSPPLTMLARMHWEDSAYARSEQAAFSLSWLSALAPLVVNRPSARGQAGAWRSALEWRSLAQSAGLAVEPFEADSDRPSGASYDAQVQPTGLVVGDDAFGVAAQPGLKPAAIQLARCAETPIIGLSFSDGPQHRLMMVTPLPDLTLGGEGTVSALERLLDS
jgi:hypothetical protein